MGRREAVHLVPEQMKMRRHCPSPVQKQLRLDVAERAGAGSLESGGAQRGEARPRSRRRPDKRGPLGRITGPRSRLWPGSHRGGA